MAEVPHMPIKSEILAKALELFHLANPEAPTPEEDELKEGNWFEAARRDLMTGVKSQLEEYLAFLESEAESIRDQLGVKPAPPPKEVRELEEQVDSLSVRLGETRRRLRETKKEIERLRAVKIPPKVIAPPPALPPKKLVCPAHPEVELIDVSETQPLEGWEFPWGRIFVPPELFLFQCSLEFEYYICEPRKRCELVSLDRLRRKLAVIIRPLVPAPPPIRVVPRAFVTLERIRAEEAKVQLHERFDEYLAEMGYTHMEYDVLDLLSKDALRKGFREWLIKQPFRKKW